MKHPQLDLNLDVLAFHSDRIGSDAEPRVGGALAGFRIVGVAVDRTHRNPVPNSASAEGAQRVRTSVVNGAECAVFVEDSDAPAVDGKRFAASFANR